MKPHKWQEFLPIWHQNTNFSNIRRRTWTPIGRGIGPPSNRRTGAAAQAACLPQEGGPGHFRARCEPLSTATLKQNEAPLLALYCTSIHLARFYANAIGDEGDDGRNHKNWTENARLSASLATKMRLTPSSRYDARQADRYSNVPSDDAPRPWDRRAGGGLD